MTGALSGIRVLDFGQYLAGPLVAQMLGDQGADVIRIDPPGGPRWASDANAPLQRGKRSIVLDLTDAADASRARALIGTVDVVVENFRPGVMAGFGLGSAAMLREHPRLVYCSLPGFAEDDERASRYAPEGVVGAAAAVYGSRDLDPAADPIYNTLPLGSAFAAMIAANCILAALIARQRAGFGQRIQVSLFDALFELMRYANDQVPGGRPRIRLGATSTMALTHHYACRDGRFVHLSWLEEGRQLEAFARLLGLTDDWTARGLLDHGRVRRDRAYSESLRAALASVFQTRTAAEWMALCNPDADLAECLSTEEWLTGSQHARATRAVIALDDPHYGPTLQMGYPVSLTRTPPRTAGPRHALDQDRAAVLAEIAAPPGRGRPASPAPAAGEGSASLRGALDGFRALDLTQLLAGPTACRILAEYGADVVQIANPAARAGTDYHLSVDNGKRTILLDLKQSGGMDVFWALVDRADVISTNFSSEVGARLGVDEPSVRRRRPDIIYSRISAYGLEGPLRDYRGHDQVGQAVTGMEVRWGRDSATPLMQPHPLNDFGTGHLAAFAILLGLFHRLRSGEGQLVGASLAQTATFIQAPVMLAYPGKVWGEPGGQLCKGKSRLERLYRASDGWLFVAARSFEQLAGTDGLHGVALDDLEQRFAEQPAAVWVARLVAAGVGAHVLRTPQEAMQDTWALGHGLSLDVDFPAAGPGRIVGPPPRLSATPMRPGAASPPLGWHAGAILDELGLGQRLAELVAQRSVLLPPEAPGSSRPPAAPSPTLA